MPSTPLVKTVRAYYLWTASFLLLIHNCLWATMNVLDRRPLASGSPLQKAEYYRRNAARFNLLFLGDSRTYCGMHPSTIDPILGTHSYNLSMFAHWLPTQYPAIQDLVADIPRGTTVVWSIGSGNFAPIGGKVHDAYPVGMVNIPRYLAWGYRWSDLESNVIYFATNDWPRRLLSKLAEYGRKPCLSLVDAASTKAAGDPRNARPDSFAAELDELTRKSRSDSSVSSIEVIRNASSGNVTSLAVFSIDGAYRRYELDREYFRQQQAAAAEELRHQEAATVAETAFTPDSAYWQTFVAILELYRQHRVHLIVNEISEAPYVYRNSASRRAEREFIRGTVRNIVEAHGFAWVSADTSSLEDDDYFDHNHLNSKGIERYTRLLAGTLRHQITAEER